MTREQKADIVLSLIGVVIIVMVIVAVGTLHAIGLR